MCMDQNTEQRIAIVEGDGLVRGIADLVGKGGEQERVELKELNHLLQHDWRVTFASPHGQTGNLLVLEATQADAHPHAHSHSHSH